MKTVETISEFYKSKTLDGRDLSRLVQFLTSEEAIIMGFTFKNGYIHEKTLEFTKEGILEQLKRDVEFGFEKALDKRGLSAGMMFEVVLMWNWILEDGLEVFDTDVGYAQYGLPLFKATAVKYGFENPIGDDVGNESIYEQ
jgi:hypothetical protein